ncbi:unnamed protein product, partial [Pylaiella littoralis]
MCLCSNVGFFTLVRSSRFRNTCSSCRRVSLNLRLLSRGPYDGSTNVCSKPPPNVRGGESEHIASFILPTHHLSLTKNSFCYTAVSPVGHTTPKKEQESAATCIEGNTTPTIIPAP